MKLRTLLLILALALAPADIWAQAAQQADAATSPAQTGRGRRGGRRAGAPDGRRPAIGFPARYGIYLPGAEPGERHTGFRKELPTLWTIGDSTVKNGREDGRDGGRWGWGDAIALYFDPQLINIENQALGGTSTRSFVEQGWWGAVMPYVQPGDYVMIQFGHNDGGRGTPNGNGDEVTTATVRGETIEVHSFGWNLRKMIRDVRERGATPIICSLIPRNTWREGKVVRGQDASYVLWAQQAAEQEGACYINLNHIIAERLDPLGEGFSKGTLYPATDGTHTTLLGAHFNAMCVVAGVKALGDGLKLNAFLSPTAQPVASAAAENVIAGKTTERPAPPAAAAAN